MKPAHPTPPAPEDTKERIYRAALQMFYEHGYSGATLRSIVRAANVQMSSVYYHYTSKQELLFDVMKRAVTESTRNLEQGLLGKYGATTRLEAALAAQVDWHTSRQQEAFIADAELRRLEGAYRDQIVALRDHEEWLFRSILEEGVASGEFDIPDVPLVTRMLLSAANGVADWYRPDGKFAPENIAEVFATALTNGLRPRPE